MKFMRSCYVPRQVTKAAPFSLSLVGGSTSLASLDTLPYRQQAVGHWANSGIKALCVNCRAALKSGL
ncbi:hypothetical protein MD588_24950 [Photobacterium sp. SDRW27]|uniref:hypothetical protein n=1 Tax=Photobacterium obscurum TaxID=2829490 RepID=UPI0022433C81|nr:hypothetical protein [Photobacterium obscurum]MCW8332045.1 hypothetical protein [Photobacterium obscurum]